MSTVGRVEWRAVFTTEGRGRMKRRFLISVEDAQMRHLSEIHMSTQCAFGRSWKAFTAHGKGVGHRALTWCRFLLGICFVFGAGAVWLVYQEWTHPNGRLCNRNFHWVVLVKFLVQDLPTQICIVLYLFGWYEASGLRCQLCLFEPQYCGDEHPFHWSNLIALLCCLLSSCANQILVRPAVKHKYNEDDLCIQYTLRIGGLCVATLPFTTAMCFASRSLLPVPLLFHVLCAVPCGIGYVFLIGTFCMPILICCDDDI